jgi:hypothetical protein
VFFNIFSRYLSLIICLFVALLFLISFFIFYREKQQTFKISQKVNEVQFSKGKHKATIKFLNPAGSFIYIEDIILGCGCVNATITNRAVYKRDSIEIELSVDDFGDRDSLMQVINLRCKNDVSIDVDFILKNSRSLKYTPSNRVLFLSPTKPRETTTKDIIIFNLSDSVCHLNISNPKSSVFLPKKDSTVTLLPFSRQIIKVNFRSLKPGIYRDSLCLLSNNKQFPKITFTLYGFVPD